MGLRQKARQASVHLLEIEQATDEIVDQLYEVEVQAHISPWTKDNILASISLPYNHCLVLYCAERVIGYAMISVVADESDLYTIGILPKYQGLGFGHILLHGTLARARDLKAQTCFLEVRTSNEVALHLYDYYGFTIVGVRKNYYEATAKTPSENAYLMKADLNTLPDLPVNRP